MTAFALKDVVDPAFADRLSNEPLTTAYPVKTFAVFGMNPTTLEDDDCVDCDDPLLDESLEILECVDMLDDDELDDTLDDESVEED